jgi:hypothetical protein
MEKFNLKELNDKKIREQCQVKISNRFVAFENSDYNVDISRAWECMIENTKSLATKILYSYKFKQHKLWFHEESSKSLDQRKQDNCNKHKKYFC